MCVTDCLHALETYSVHVIADAVSSRSLHYKDIALRRMEEAAMFELMQKADSELFKKALPLPVHKTGCRFLNK